MNKQEFISKLTKSFKDSNEVIIDDLSDWIDRNELTEFQLMSLYDKIKLTYRYKTFPTLAEIAGYFNDDFGQLDKDFNDSPIVKFRKDMRRLKTEELFKRLDTIYKKHPESRNTFDMDLWHDFEALYAEYLIMLDLKYDKKSIADHLKYVHEKILKDEYFASKFNEAKKNYIEV